MEQLPLGSKYDSHNKDEVADENLPTHMLCPNPHLDHTGKGKLDLSVNGLDFHGNFAFEFSEPLDVYRISPTAGPKEGNTRVKFIGSGYSQAAHPAFGKFGTISTVPLKRDQVTQMAWDQASYLATLLQTGSDLRLYRHENYKLAEGDSLDSVVVTTPPAPGATAQASTMGGAVYVSVG